MTTRTPEEEAHYQGFLERAKFTAPEMTELLNLVQTAITLLSAERMMVERGDESAYAHFDRRLRFLEALETRCRAHLVILPDYRP